MEVRQVEVLQKAVTLSSEETPTMSPPSHSPDEASVLTSVEEAENDDR